MSETDASYLPHIPYSRLKELKYHAELVVVAIAGNAFTGSDLWRIYVGLEVNSLLASYWYEQFEQLRLENSELLQCLENIKISISNYYIVAEIHRKHVEKSQATHPDGTESQGNSE